MSLEINIDDITQNQWQDCVRSFADYSIYQTWAYQQQRAETEGLELSRFIIRDGLQAVSMGQVRIMNIKFVGIKIGYVQWGPLMRGKDNILLCSSETLGLLRRSYLGSRVNILRLVPNIADGENGQEVVQMLQNSGFKHVKNIKPYHTIILPLKASEEELRKNLHQKWRNMLNKAEKMGLEFKYSNNGDSFDIFESLYQLTAERKNFDGLDIKVFRESQHGLEASEKMNVIAAYCEGRPITAHISSNLGDTAVVLFAAANDDALKHGATNITWWRAFLAAKQAGMKICDLGGIDPINNPGVYQFKNRVGGKEIFHIGTFEACSSGFTKSAWHVIQTLHRAVKKGK